MFRRVIFCFLLLIILLLLSIVKWARLSIDINVHDTYFVLSYLYALLPPLVTYLLVVTFYWQLGKRKVNIGPVFQWVHVILSYLTTIFYVFQTFGEQIGVSGMTNRYFAITEAPSQIDAVVFAGNFVLFIVVQLVFFAVAISKALKYRKQHN